MTVLKKLPVARVKDAIEGQAKFHVGRVVMMQNPMMSPISNTPCAYYEVEVEKLVKRGKSHHWKVLFRESKCSDFILADPEGNPAFVPGISNTVKFYAQVDARGSGGGAFHTPVPTSTNPGLNALLQRHGVSTEGFFGSSIGSPRLRYREGTYHVNEVVAILGVPTQGVVNGVPMTILHPCDPKSIPDSYFQRNNWSGLEKDCWNDLTSSRSLIGSDDPRYLKGCTVPALYNSYTPCALAMPVVMPVAQPVSVYTDGPAPPAHGGFAQPVPAYAQQQVGVFSIPQQQQQQYVQKPAYEPPQPAAAAVPVQATGAAALYQQQYNPMSPPQPSAPPAPPSDSGDDAPPPDSGDDAPPPAYE